MAIALAETEEISKAAPPDAEFNDVRVLIVDDDPAFRRICHEYLKEQGHGVYEVFEASDAASATELSEGREFDCILIDYRLPDETGTGLMRRLSEDAVLPVPMIILTGVGSEDIAMEAVHGGAADYIPKCKVSRDSLHRAIKNTVTKARLENSVRLRTQKLEAANRELHRKKDQIERFYHTVSHEIKTPLTAAREFIALVADGVMGDITTEQGETLAYAIDSCDQLAEHINDLIESTRLDTGKMKINKKPNKIETMIRRSVAAVRPAVMDKSISLKESMEHGLPMLNVDGSRIVQVLSNLLANAVKFTDAGGEISITAEHDRCKKGWVKICVSDSGCGISEEHLPLIFDRLYQVNDGGDYLMGAGLGLGLSIAREIVALHGGHLDVESEFGIGSIFCIRIPAEDAASGDMPKPTIV